MYKLFFSGCCLYFLATAVNAQSLHPALDDNWQFTLGAFNQHNEANVRVTAPGDSETNIDLDNLGLEASKWIPQFGVRWSFKKKWRLSFAYSDFNLTSSRGVNTSFNFDGVTYPVNASLKSKHKLRLYITSLDYVFLKSEATEWGLGLGLHAIDVGLKIDASLNGVTLASASEDVIAPLPNIRFYTRHAFSPKLLASFNIGWLGATIDEYDGQLIVGAVALDYRFTKRWSVGVNYQVIDIDLKVDRGSSEPKSKYDVVLDGFSLTLRYGIP